MLCFTTMDYMLMRSSPPPLRNPGHLLGRDENMFSFFEGAKVDGAGAGAAPPPQAPMLNPASGLPGSAGTGYGGYSHASHSAAEARGGQGHASTQGYSSYSHHHGFHGGPHGNGMASHMYPSGQARHHANNSMAAAAAVAASVAAAAAAGNPGGVAMASGSCQHHSRLANQAGGSSTTPQQQHMQQQGQAQAQPGHPAQHQQQQSQQQQSQQQQEQGIDMAGQLQQYPGLANHPELYARLQAAAAAKRAAEPGPGAQAPQAQAQGLQAQVQQAAQGQSGEQAGRQQPEPPSLGQVSSESESSSAGQWPAQLQAHQYPPPYARVPGPAVPQSRLQGFAAVERTSSAPAVPQTTAGGGGTLGTVIESGHESGGTSGRPSTTATTVGSGPGMGPGPGQVSGLEPEMLPGRRHYPKRRSSGGRGAGGLGQAVASYLQVGCTFRPLVGKLAALGGSCALLVCGRMRACDAHFAGGPTCLRAQLVACARPADSHGHLMLPPCASTHRARSSSPWSRGCLPASPPSTCTPAQWAATGPRPGACSQQHLLHCKYQSLVPFKVPGSGLG